MRANVDCVSNVLFSVPDFDLRAKLVQSVLESGRIRRRGTGRPLHEYHALWQGRCSITDTIVRRRVSAAGVLVRNPSFLADLLYSNLTPPGRPKLPLDVARRHRSFRGLIGLIDTPTSAQVIILGLHFRLVAPNEA